MNYFDSSTALAMSLASSPTAGDEGEDRMPGTLMKKKKKKFKSDNVFHKGKQQLFRLPECVYGVGVALFEDRLFGL